MNPVIKSHAGMDVKEQGSMYQLKHWNAGELQLPMSDPQNQLHILYATYKIV